LTMQWSGGVAIVDDEEALTDLIAAMLDLKGILVCFKAYDGREAMQKFREHNPKPEVVIMDYRLTSTNGIEVMKEMKQMYNGSMFIFLSADSAVRDEALKAGAEMFLAKPSSMKDLIDAVERVAGSQRKAAGNGPEAT